MLNNGAKWYNFSPPRWSFIAPPLTESKWWGDWYADACRKSLIYAENKDLTEMVTKWYTKESKG